MFTQQTITKNILEKIVHKTFSNFGFLSSSSLLDSLKLLGFYYATNAGISISIEDLITPEIKNDFIEIANEEIDSVSQSWEKGLLSDGERFQTIIDSWNGATESLKNRIVDYYQQFDPANNLYLMAFSGARGNMAQVRQLVGMRGLMSDQEGKIIDLPIQRNFREGLSSIDYIISSYGARKGIVDTALKTADSGYLTRRLIYLSQDLVIREVDCKTKKGVTILLKENTTSKNLIGRSLLRSQKKVFPYLPFTNQETLLTDPVLGTLKENAPLILHVRSPLTCLSTGSICQKCYGWDLGKNKLISLGEAVGITAAQSIGEPGTQLTMRTFHTGGIFTGEMLKQIVSPFSGKVFFPKEVKSILFRTNHGQSVLKIQQETILSLINWQGKQEEIFLDIGSYLYLKGSGFVIKGQLLAESPTNSIISNTRKLKPIYTSLAGEIKYRSMRICKRSRPNYERLKILEKSDGEAWIAAGQICILPKEAKFGFPRILEKKKAIAKLKIITPINGLVQYENSSLKIIQKTQEKVLTLDLEKVLQSYKNCRVNLQVIISNYQYVDAFTTLGYIYIYPEFEGLLHGVRIKGLEEKKQGRVVLSPYYGFLFITEKDIWRINSDQINNTFFSNFIKEKKRVRIGELINQTSLFSRSGFLLKKEGFQLLFQNAVPIFLSQGTILKYNSGDLVGEKKIFATLVNYTQQTEDIVQGLPKIEELIEARKPKNPCVLALRPGVLLNIPAITLDGEKPEPLHRMQNEQDIVKIILDKEDVGFQKVDFLEKKDSFSVFGEEEKKEKKKGKNKNKEKIKETIFSLEETELFLDEKEKLLREKLEKDYDSKKKEKRKKEKKFVQIAHSFFCKEEIVVCEDAFYKASVIPSVFSPVYLPKSGQYLFRNQNNSEELSPEKGCFLVHGKIKFSKWMKKELFVLKEKKEGTFSRFFNNQLFPWKSVVGRECEIEGIDFFAFEVYQNKKEDYILPMENHTYFYLEKIQPMTSYELPLNAKMLIEPGHFVDLGEPITEGIIEIHELLKVFFNYHSILDGTIEGTFRSLNKFQLLLVNSIQSIYQSQGVSISSKHIEIIVRQMTSKVMIQESGDTPFLPGELISLSLMTEIYKTLQESQSSIRGGYKTPKYEPKLLSATTCSLNKDGFLNSAGFQETRRVLAKAAIEGTSDWLRGLKESIIVGRLIPAGSAFLNYKNYLDNIYLFKE